MNTPSDDKYLDVTTLGIGTIHHIPCMSTDTYLYMHVCSYRRVQAWPCSLITRADRPGPNPGPGGVCTNQARCYNMTLDFR
jgi:hypothetical protein